MLRTPALILDHDVGSPVNAITPCVDFGGTSIKLGLVAPDRVMASTAIPARSGEPLARRLPAVAEALGELARDSGLRWREGAKLGVAFPSIIDPHTARPLDAYGKFLDAPSLDLATWAASLGLGLAIDNDARMALLGECAAGAGRGVGDVAMVTLGTGIGTAALVGGKLLRGRHGQAGILGGHVTLDLDDARCHCGNVGCAETLASTAALSRLTRSDPRFGESALGRETILDFSAVFTAAAAGDPLAVSLRERAINVWAATIVNLIHAYDPERVIVGGGVAAAGDALFDGLREQVLDRAHTPWGHVEIVPAELGQSSALIGVAALARGEA